MEESFYETRVDIVAEATFVRDPCAIFSARGSVGLLARLDRWPPGGPPVSLWVGGLPDLDDVPIGISDVATDLVLVLLRRRQELRAPGAPFGVHGVDVRDPDIEEAADPVGVAWRLKGDRGLVVGGASAAVDDDEAVGERDIGRLWAEDHRAAKYLGIEATGALEVIGDDEVGHQHSLCGLRGLGHWHLHSLRANAPLATGSEANVATIVGPNWRTVATALNERPGVGSHTSCSHSFHSSSLTLTVARPEAFSHP